MYYHFAILLLFRPLIKLRIIGSNVSPREVCTQAADAIQGLLHSYSSLYTLRRTPSFVPYFVLTSSIIHLAIAASAPSTPGGERDGSVPSPTDPGHADLGEKVTKSINQGIEDLAEMAPCHHFAEQALNILRYLAKKWNIRVDVDVADKLRKEKADAGKTNERGGAVDVDSVQIGHRMKDHAWGTQPRTNSRNFFSPNVQQRDFVSTWGSAMPDPTRSKSPPLARTGEAMENPLFWPFPMQGRPMLPEGELLKDAGFELVS